MKRIKITVIIIVISLITITVAIGKFLNTENDQADILSVLEEYELGSDIKQCFDSYQIVDRVIYARYNDVTTQEAYLYKWSYESHDEPILLDTIKLGYPDKFTIEKDKRFECMSPMLRSTLVLDDGSFYAFFRHLTIEDYQKYLNTDKSLSDSKDMYTEEYYLNYYDAKGNLKKSSCLTEKMSSYDIQSISSVLAYKGDLNNGELVVMINGDEYKKSLGNEIENIVGKDISGLKNKVLILDSEGNVLRNIETPDSQRIAKTSLGEIIYSDNRHIMVLSDNEEMQKKYSKIVADDFYSCAQNEKYIFLYRKGNEVYGVNQNLKEQLLIHNTFTYLRSDVFCAYDSLSIYLDNELHYSVNGKLGCYIKRLHQPDTLYEDSRVEIRMALLRENTYIRMAIADYNRTSQDYVITVMDYTKEENPEQKLAEDIGKGVQIDIYDLAGYDTSFLTDKDLLTDIAKMIEKDAELSTDDFIEGVYSAMCDDDSIYEMIIAYSMLAMLTIPDRFNGVDNWNYETMKELTYAYPEVSYSAELMNYTYIARREEWVNSTNGSCGFDTDSFKNCISEGIERLPVMDERFTSITTMDILQTRGYVPYIMTYTILPAMFSVK